MSYSERKAQLIEILGGKCVECSSTENLEFDHVDPREKRFVITVRWAYKLETLLKELEKCQLLCNPCHKKKTSQARKSKLNHGTISMYKWRRCRCQPCREVWNAACRKWKHRD